jgi:hypothetical protein
MRQTFIADSLAWIGVVRSRDLVSRFGITPQQAHKDFCRFESDHPGAVRYDKRKQTWLKDGGFPTSLKDDIATVLERRPDLRELLGFHSVSAIGRVWPLEKRKIVETLIEARLTSTCMEILYQSMTSPTEAWRTVCPHAFFEDWVVGYVRVYDHKRDKFIDLRIDRIKEIRSGTGRWVGSESDIDWSTSIDVRIGANPDLAEQQQRSCLYEIGIGPFEGTIPVRRSHLFYTLRRLSLLEAVQEGHGRPDKSKMYVCLNSLELQPYLPISKQSQKIP